MATTDHGRAEQIVRALAAIPDPTVTDRDYAPSAECGLCGMADKAYEHASGDSANHEPTCPWRMAQEWVASTPSSDVGPERTADANPDPSLVPAIRRRIRITRDEIARLEANVAADEAWLRSLTDDG